MALGILVFPCECDAAGPTTGILNLPTEISNTLHCIIAAILFGSFAYMIGFRFTKTALDRKVTVRKKKRNVVYIVCASIIAFFMLLQAITATLGIGWMTIVNETFMLWAFSFAWAVKADTFKCFAE